VLVDEPIKKGECKDKETGEYRKSKGKKKGKGKKKREEPGGMEVQVGANRSENQGTKRRGGKYATIKARKITKKKRKKKRSYKV